MFVAAITCGGIACGSNDSVPNTISDKSPDESPDKPTTTACDQYLSDVTLAAIKAEMDAAVDVSPELTQWSQFLANHSAQNAALPVTDGAFHYNWTWTGASWAPAAPTCKNCVAWGGIDWYRAVIDYADGITLATHYASHTMLWNSESSFQAHGLPAGTYSFKQNHFTGPTKDFGAWKYAQFDDDMTGTRNLNKEAPFGKSFHATYAAALVEYRLSLRLPSYQLEVTVAPSATTDGSYSATLWMNGDTLFSSSVTEANSCSVDRLEKAFPNTGELLRSPILDAACPGVDCPGAMAAWAE